MRLSIQSKALLLLAATAASAFVFHEHVKNEMRVTKRSRRIAGDNMMINTITATAIPSCLLFSPLDFIGTLREVDVEIDVTTKDEGSVDEQLLRQISHQVFGCHNPATKQASTMTTRNQQRRWTQKLQELGVSTFSIQEVKPISCPPSSTNEAIYSCGRTIVSLAIDESIHPISPESTERARALIGAALSSHAMTFQENHFPRPAQFRDLRSEQAKNSKATKTKAKSSKQSPLLDRGKGLTAPSEEPLDPNDVPSSSIPTRSPAEGNDVQQTTSSIPTQSPSCGNDVQQDMTSSPVASGPTGDFGQDGFNPDVITPTLAPMSGTGGSDESSTYPSTAPISSAGGDIGSTTVPSVGPTRASIPSSAPTSMVLTTPTSVPTTNSQINASEWPSMYPTRIGDLDGNGDGTDESTQPSGFPTDLGSSPLENDNGSTSPPKDGTDGSTQPSGSPTDSGSSPLENDNGSTSPVTSPTIGDDGSDYSSEAPSDVPSMVPSIAPTPSDGSDGNGSTPSLGTDPTSTDDTIGNDENTSSSEVPSMVPSLVPTLLKSDYPSINPMEWPEVTAHPTASPGSGNSDSPSIDNSSSTTPTDGSIGNDENATSSDAPSDVPSTVPSQSPTLLKSDYPSINPMEWPEVTAHPTASSGSGNSDSPSIDNSSSTTPTDGSIGNDENATSSDAPSDVPSTVPSQSPTLLKSDYPSINPMEWPEVTASPTATQGTTDSTALPTEGSSGNDTPSTDDTMEKSENSDAPSDVPSMVPSFGPTSSGGPGGGVIGGDDPASPVPTPSEPTLPRICEASDGDFGNDLGISSVISFGYELEVDPTEVSGTVSSEVLPTLEQTMVEFLLPVFFPEICRDWDSNTLSTQVGFGRHRRLAALGISASPTDQILDEMECKQLNAETNGCSFVSGAITIHHYFVDPESVIQMTLMALERLKLGMDTSALLDAHPSIRRISYVNDTGEPVAPTSTQSPIVSTFPTASESPSASRSPTATESPSLSSAPTASALPSTSVSPSIFIEDSLPEAIVDGGPATNENDRVGIGLGVALAAVLVLLILALLVGRHQIIANRKGRMSDVGMYGAGLLPLAGGFGDDNRRIVGTGDPPGSFHEGLYHYTDEGTRYLSTNCADCLETRRNSFYTDDNLGTIPEDQEYEDSMYCAPALYTSDDDSEVMASSYLQHLVNSKKVAPPDVHVCTSTMCTDPRCSNRNKPYSPRQSTTFLGNPATWVTSREAGPDEPMDSLLTLGHDDRTSTRAGEQEV